MSRFVEQHRATWERLQAILDAIDTRGFRRLSREQLDQFAGLYRQAVAHLAQARTQGEDLRVVRYLNELVARAHGRIYRRRGRHVKIGEFFLETFPRTFRRTLWYTVVAAVVMYGAAALAYGAVRADPELARYLFDENFVRYMENFLERKDAAERYFQERTSGAGGAELSTFLMRHNVEIAFLTFAGGVTGGVLSLYLLMSNGLMLGVFLAMAANHGHGLGFWAILAPHGVAELSAICIAGGAALRMAYPLIDPGDLRRVEAFVQGAREAAVLILGTIPLFVGAGVIEGFVAPSNLDWPSRFGVAALSGGLMLVYLFFGDRLRRRPARRAGAGGIRAARAP